MGRSQILKDMVSGDDQLESVLWRLKIILSDLENEEINNWIDNELRGYDDTADVPPYRVLTGRPVGAFIMGGFQHKNAEIPTAHLDKEGLDRLQNVQVMDGISGINSLLEKENGTIGKSIPTDYCHVISRPGMLIQGMTVTLSVNQIKGILSNIKSNLMDILLKIEKEFGNLDTLDTFSEENNLDPQAVENLQQFIINVVYDKSIKIGDHNKIKSSEIGHEG